MYQARRARLAQMIGDAFFVLRGAGEMTRNNDVIYPFRQESSFLYLTGWTHPDAFLIIEGGEHPRSMIFFDPQGERERLFNENLPTYDAAIRNYGFDDARARTHEFVTTLNELAKVKQVLYHDAHAPLTFSDFSLAPYVEDMMRDGNGILATIRIIKDGVEITAMRKAAHISGLAHRELMKCVHPGCTEYQLAALFAYRVSCAGADPQNAYPSIVASGEHACTLHYVKNSAKIRDGDLVLVDAGCEIDGYASDITRTFPANGTFTEAQRILYEIVLGAQKLAIMAAACGNTIGDVHKTASLAIASGLIRQGILKDPNPETAVKTGSTKRFFPHGTSHWLGLDVHDIGDYSKGQRELVPGMVITVEPGIYIPKDMKDVDKRFRGIGIRIEDDVLITENGNEVLSWKAPKETDEIEEIVSAGHS